MNIIFSIILCLCIPFCLNGQYLLEFHTEADDSFREWDVLIEKDSTEIEGNLRLTWGINNNWTEWQYSIGDFYGEIVQKFNNNPGFWELRSDDRVVTIRQAWPGDLSEWKISCGERKFTFRTVFANQYDEWALMEREMGELVIYTEIPADVRDWVVSDYMVDEITFEERMAAVFIALFSSIPKF